MEHIIVVVGFLGAGKTTLLKKVIKESQKEELYPFVIINDYENAYIDAQGLLKFLDEKQVRALSGSCICCSGVNELREQVNRIPKRERGITLIEANGTTDAVSLMGFLGVGVEPHFYPPIQVGVVDARHWQKRGIHNELEANQVQVSSLIILNHSRTVNQSRLEEVEKNLRVLNPTADIIYWDEFDINILAKLKENNNVASKMQHEKTHWSSCSVNFPDPITSEKLKEIVDAIPVDFLRVKGCTKVDNDSHYTHFERTPDGEIYTQVYSSSPLTGAKILTIGPGSDPDMLRAIIEKQIN